MAPQVWELDPDIKMIHYVRDPRGTVVSRLLLGNKKAITQGTTSASMGKDLCDRLRDDLHYSDQLLQDQPGSFIRVRYEDLAYNPIATLDVIYRSIGMNTPHALYTWIKRSTNSTKDNGGMGTLRKNSTEVATKWQRLLSNETKLKYLEFCLDVLTHLGYDKM
jgi:hypothetical protein